MLTRSIFGLLLLLSGCAQMPYIGDKVNASLADVRVAKIGPIEQTYALKIRLQNPTAKTFEFKGLSFDVELNGRHFARGVSPQALALAPYGDILVDVTAVSDTPALLTQLVRLKGGTSKMFRYRLTGSLHIPQSARSYLAFEQNGEVDFAGFTSTGEGLDQVEEK